MSLDRRNILAGAMTLLAPVTVGAGPRVTPLRLIGNRIYLTATINGIATEALLDSGAEMTVLDTGFAARLRLGDGTAVTARGTGTATTQAALIAGAEMHVAGLTLRPETVAVIDLGDISARLAHRRIDAIVGRDLFDASRLAIDLSGGTLVPIGRRREPAGDRLTLTGRRGIETVPIRVEGFAAQAEFDLGNGGRMLIGKAFAAARGLPGRRPTTRIGGGGIGGETLQTAFVLRHVDIAGQRILDVPVAIDASDTAADANIGVALLRRFRIVTDFAERAVWLQAR